MPQINLSGGSTSSNPPPVPPFSASGTFESVSAEQLMATGDSAVDLRKHPSGIVPVLQ
jgi:hypothetical protein